MRTSKTRSPVYKLIDTWTFSIGGKRQDFWVHIRRPRDIEDAAGKISFEVRVVDSMMRENGFNYRFPDLRGPSLSELRDKLAAYINGLVKATWKRVILVGCYGAGLADPDTAGDMLCSWYLSADSEHMLTFNFCVAEQSADGKLFRRISDGWINRKHVLYPCPCPEEEVRVYPYSEELEKSLQEVKARMGVLARQLHSLIQPANIGRLQELVKTGNLLTQGQE